MVNTAGVTLSNHVRIRKKNSGAEVRCSAATMFCDRLIVWNGNGGCMVCVFSLDKTERKLFTTTINQSMKSNHISSFRFWKVSESTVSSTLSVFGYYTYT
mmetsp:Transcript_53110/g.128949  ORF Transcript_53110/g.128949 Transcript_53110/m.128949 type:complete len:100 (-) Transcript_53110:71-370(-)